MTREDEEIARLSRIIWDIQLQAERHKRATNLKKYLERDLEFIEAQCKEGLKDSKWDF